MTMKITANDLARHDELKQRLAELDAQAKPLKDEVAQIRKRAFAFLEENEKETAKRGGFRISMVVKAGRQAWKDLAMKWKPANEEIPKPDPVKKLVITKA